MGGIPYIVKKYSMYDLEQKEFHMELMKESFGEAYELKQIIPIVVDGNTDGAFGVFAENFSLLKTIIHLDDRDSIKYLTADQIKILDLKKEVKIEGENRRIVKIDIDLREDNVHGMCVHIYLEK